MQQQTNHLELFMFFWQYFIRNSNKYTISRSKRLTRIIILIMFILLLLLKIHPHDGHSSMNIFILVTHIKQSYKHVPSLMGSLKPICIQSKLSETTYFHNGVRYLIFVESPLEDFSMLNKYS